MDLVIVSMICAILAPIIAGLMNVIDKYVVSLKVKNVLSFAFISGITNIVIGTVLALCINWSDITFAGILFPMLAGILMGINYYFYFIMMSMEDASSVMGFNYFYPVIVAVLSVLFLNEVLSLVAYFGMMLILAGVVMLTIRMHKLKFKVAIWMIISMMIVSALYRFFIKISTIRIPEINGIAINSIFIGIMLLPLLFHKKTREGIKYELKNAKWALLGESLTIISMVATYIAMKNLPATLVSAVAAAQPLSILLLETIFGCLGITICRDKNILHKLIPLSLIVAGIILMYVFKG